MNLTYIRRRRRSRRHWGGGSKGPPLVKRGVGGDNYVGS